MKLFLMLFTILLTACVNKNQSVYDNMGGHSKLEQLVDNFITEIEYDPIMFNFFKDSDVNRFREKLIEHLCMLTEGPCQYTGDTMEQVHAGMSITEADFNHGVDLFIQAMNQANIPHSIQNKILAKIAPTRKNIIYL